MKKRFSLPSFLSGVLATLLAAALAIPATAALAGKTVTVYPGVSIYVDDNLIPQQGAVYEGTTYLPVRAVSEALDKNVQWDGSTQSVYVGKHASDKPAVWLKDLDYFYGTGSFLQTSTPIQDNYGNTYNSALYIEGTISYYADRPSFSRTYHINGQYSKITGTTFISYADRSKTLPGGIGIEIYGDDVLLYTNRLSDENVTQYSPVGFEIDLTNVLNLEFRYFGGHFESQAALYLGDCGLWT